MFHRGQQVQFYSVITEQTVTGIVDEADDQWVTVGRWKVLAENVTAIDEAGVGELVYPPGSNPGPI